MILSRFLGLAGLATLVSSAVISSPASAAAQKRDTSTDYDYVVVGSGAGGGPLAARLAIAGYKVLLIDAGDDQGSALQQQVPALHLFATEYEPMRWDYFVNHYSDLTEQEKDSKMVYQTPSGQQYVGLDPPSGSTPLGILYPRSGTLGGCTTHNALITIYPHESDWDNIASLTGDSSWAASNMRQYFERLENCHYLPNDVVGHGFNGWLETALTNLELVVEDQKLLSLIISAATALGQGILGSLLTTVAGVAQVLISDINADTPGRDQEQGLYQVPLAMSVPDYKRNGPREFILNTANNKQYHLDVQLNTLVTKVRFDTSGSTPKAIGVDYLSGSHLYKADPQYSASSSGTPGSVNATREVILAAGSFNTPQLLKLSGIGPQEELQSFNIPVLVNSPGVGTNLQDRYETGLVGETTSDFVITAQCTFMQSMPDPCLTQWETNPIDKGTYGTNGIAIAIVHKSSSASSSDPPDLLISGAPAYFKGYYPGYAQIALEDARHWTWITLKAHSRNNAGTVQLRSADPRDTPLINFNSFQTGGDLDLEAVYESMELSRKMFADLIPLDGSFTEVWPGPNVTSEADLKSFITKETWGHHASCTCPIGADGDPNAVLDSKFNVRGVTGLRVVDASVFPKIPGFYIALPIYMISEKAADVIVADAKATSS